MLFVSIRGGTFFFLSVVVVSFAFVEEDTKTQWCPWKGFEDFCGCFFLISPAPKQA
jgi:hypothetical protein